MFTINIQPGAIVINQDSRELPAVLVEMARMAMALAAVQAKVDTLVPDAAQLEALTTRLRESTDRQEVDVQNNTPA